MSAKRVLLAGLLAFFALGAQHNPSQDGSDDWIIVGEDATLAEGETVNGDVVVIGGDLRVESGGRVRGDVVTVGGTLSQEGDVDGDLVTIGSALEIGPDTTVRGDTVAIGGDAEVAEGAMLQGTYVTIPGPDLTGLAVPARPRLRARDRTFDTERLVPAAVNAAVLALLAAIVLQAWDTRVARIGEAASTAPIAAGGLGILSMILFPLLSVMFGLTLLLIPLSLLLVLLFMVVLLFGWAAMGLLLGERLLEWLGIHDASAEAAGIAGTFALSLLLGLFGAVPGLRLLGAASAVLLAAVGIGAVTLTRFGGRSHLPPARGDAARRARTEPQSPATSEQT